jgi:GH15 family glucan-1,4-alpha-glucosidase
MSDNLDFAIIGNCRSAALVDTQGRIAWWCFPRFDSDPVFSRLLAGNDEKGFCDIVLDHQVSAQAKYLRNTAMVETVLTDSHGGSVRITDFCPRFGRFERTFRPSMIIRRIEPVAGLPRIRIRVRPTFNYGGPCAETVLGSNHIRYLGGEDVLRLTTNASVTYIAEETQFALTRPISLILGTDEPFLGSIETTTREFQDRTRELWLAWVRGLAIPFEWQDAVIRAAITLKLCSYEETGGIVAALTTSIPEAPGTPRNWDYRYCWLRDAYFVVQALNRLGATQTMESYIDYITTVVTDRDVPLAPVHSIVPGTPLEEYIAKDLAGFLGQGPVRVGNQAVEQIQHDAYGSVILGASQMFIDERLPSVGDGALFVRLEELGNRALRFALTPDAGLWEYRGRQRIHTYSVTLCWAACNRLAQIATRLQFEERATFWRHHAERLKSEILSRGWNETRGSFVGAFDQSDLDASVLLLPELGLLAPDDERYVRTVDTIGRELERNGRIMRYVAQDDFGMPETAFLVCSFWHVDALAAIGRKGQAREMYSDILAHRNVFGILSEDLHPITGQLWGNFPQTYSMAGIIVSAMRLSQSWEEAWFRV